MIPASPSESMKQASGNVYSMQHRSIQSVTYPSLSRGDHTAIEEIVIFSYTVCCGS